MDKFFDYSNYLTKVIVLRDSDIIFDVIGVFIKIFGMSA
jgi:hypothetical protein